MAVEISQNSCNFCFVNWYTKTCIWFGQRTSLTRKCKIFLTSLPFPTKYGRNVCEFSCLDVTTNEPHPCPTLPRSIGVYSGWLMGKIMADYNEHCYVPEWSSPWTVMTICLFHSILFRYYRFCHFDDSSENVGVHGHIADVISDVISRATSGSCRSTSGFGPSPHFPSFRTRFLYYATFLTHYHNHFRSPYFRFRCFFDS